LIQRKKKLGMLKVLFVYLLLGLALQYLNKFQEAIDCYRKAINIDPKYTNAINGLK